MKNARASLVLSGAMALSLAAFSQAPGSPERWVSNTGTDVGSCLIAAPCRTFTYAVTQTPAWGQLGVLNAGDYGPVTITQAVKIDGGGLGSIQVTSGNGITVNTPAGNVVQIANLGIHGNGAQNGIDFVGAGGLDIDNVQLTGFNNDGIDVVSGGVFDLVIKNTTIENCAGHGIQIGTPDSGTAKIVNTHVRFANFGLEAADTVTVSVFNSTFSSPGNPTTSGTGIDANGSNILLDNVQVSGFGYGVNADNGGVIQLGSVQVSRSSFIDNSLALKIGPGGTIISNGDNRFYGNGSIGTFTKTVPLQ